MNIPLLQAVLKNLRDLEGQENLSWIVIPNDKFLELIQKYQLQKHINNENCEDYFGPGVVLLGVKPSKDGQEILLRVNEIIEDSFYNKELAVYRKGDPFDCLVHHIEDDHWVSHLAYLLIV